MSAARVIDRDGNTGTLEAAPDGQEGRWLLRTDQGLLDVPANLLTEVDDGTYRLPLTFPELAGRHRLLEVEERLHVRRVERETGRVRVSTHVDTREELVDEPVVRETVEVERVPKNTYVEAPQAIRHDGDTVVVPVYEEVLVVERRLLLREEVRLTKRRDETRTSQRVALRRTRVEIERKPGHDTPSDGTS